MRKPAFLRMLINWKQVGPHPVRKLVLTAMVILLIVCLLAVFLPPWAKHHPQIVAYGFISFAITFLIIWVSGLLYGIISTIYGCRKYPTLWKPHRYHSWADKYRDNLRISRLDDPFFKKIGRLFNN